MLKKSSPHVSDHFFIVGAQRSGTTYLYELLAEHPEVEMAKPLRPEPKFFLDERLFERGPQYYNQRFFEGKPGAWLRGEKSTSYIESEKAAQRIAEHYPQAKIIFVLRNPITRAISNYWFSVYNGVETQPLSEALLKEGERRSEYDAERFSSSPFAYLQRGLYIDYIDMYEKYFSTKYIKIILQEKLVVSVDAVRNIYSFLNISPDFRPTMLYRKVNAREGAGKDASLSPELKGWLREYFAESNARLSEHCGLSLREWDC